MLYYNYIPQPERDKLKRERRERALAKKAAKHKRPHGMVGPMALALNGRSLKSVAPFHPKVKGKSASYKRKLVKLVRQWGWRCADCRKRIIPIPILVEQREVIRKVGNHVRWIGRRGRQLVALKATLDHIQPKAWGGGNHISNLEPVCQPCNHARAAKLGLSVPKTPFEKHVHRLERFGWVPLGETSK